MSSTHRNFPAGSIPEIIPSRTGYQSSCERTIRFHVGFILFVGLVVRIPFYLAFRPIWSGDSASYSAFYDMWRHHL